MYSIDRPSFEGCGWINLSSDSFEEARKNFIDLLTDGLGSKICIFTGIIRDYFEKNHPGENVPEMRQLINYLKTAATNPEEIAEIDVSDYDDGIIEFYIDEATLYMYVKNDNYLGKFPQAEIHVGPFNNPEDEYFFYITNNNDKEFNIILEKE